MLPTYYLGELCQFDTRRFELKESKFQQSVAEGR
jgi:hypothetical protein